MNNKYLTKNSRLYNYLKNEKDYMFLFWFNKGNNNSIK